MLISKLFDLPVPDQVQDDRFFGVPAPARVMALQDHWIGLAGDDAAGLVRAQSLQSLLAAALALVFEVIHLLPPCLDDDLVDLLKGIDALGSEAVDDIGAGLEGVGLAGGYLDAFERREISRVVSP